MEWIIFALIAPFLYAVGNMIDRFLLEKKIKNTSVLFGVSCITTLCFSWEIIIFQWSLLPPFPIIIASIVAGLMWGITFVIYFFTLQREESSRVINLIYLFPISTLIFETTLLKTSFNVYQITGTILTVLGAALTIYKSSQKQEGEKTISLNIIFLLTLYIVITERLLTYEKYLLGYVHAIRLLPLEFIGVSMIGIFIFAFHKKARAELVLLFKKEKSILALSLISESLGFGGDLFFFLAAMFVPITLVSILSSAQILFVLLMTIFFFPKILQE